MACSQETAKDLDGEETPLICAGDMETLRNRMYQLLVECGWQEELRQLLRGVISKQDLYDIRYEDIAVEVIPKVSQMVPEVVRQDLEAQLREILGMTYK